jgi:hypothetical protein
MSKGKEIQNHLDQIYADMLSNWIHNKSKLKPA